MLKSLDEEIAELVPEEELEEEIQHADQQIERMYSTIAKINKALGPNVRATTPPVEKTAVSYTHLTLPTKRIV